MSTQSRSMDVARAELGTKESPPGSNQTAYGRAYGMDGQPWCAQFVTWVHAKAGGTTLVLGSRYAYVPYIEEDARAGRHGLWDVAKEKGEPGDIITFDWDGNGLGNHVGLVEKNLGGGDYQTIEGNTSTSDDSDGGEVMRRTRFAADVNLIARYKNEEGGSSEPPAKKRYRPIHYGPN